MITSTRGEHRPARARRHAVLALAVSVATVAGLVVAAGPAAAHTPHDNISDVVVSAAFAKDHTVFAISDNRALRSTDGGEHWFEMARGLTGQPVARFATTPADPQVVYLASRGGGVYRSTDQGGSWTATDTGSTLAYASGVAVSPRDADVVVASAGLYGGLFRTTTGGRSWGQLPGIGKVDALEFVPRVAGRVVIGGDDGSVQVSDDAGATFRAVDAPTGGAAVSAIAVAPGAAGRTVFLATDQGAVLRSTDGGVTWASVGSGFRQAVAGLAASSTFASDRTLWASTYRGGIQRSTDGGATWRRASRGLSGDAQANRFKLPMFQGIAVGPTASGGQRLFAAGYDGLFVSDDDGSRWHEVQTLSEYLTGLAVSPAYRRDGTVVVNSYVKGVFISRDRGKRFASANRGLRHPISEGNKFLPLKRMHNVVFSPDYAHDHTIFTTTWTEFVTSRNGGRSWHGVTVAPPPPDSDLRQFVIGVSPAYATDRTIFLGTRQGDLYRSTDSGKAGTWRTAALLGSRVRSIVLSPGFATDHTMFASTELHGVQRSTDGGDTWTRVGPAELAVLAISPDFVADGTLFAGTTTGLEVSHDRGDTWASAPGSSPAVVGVRSPVAAGRIEAVALSPAFATDRTMLVSVSGTGLFRSTDGGGSFRPVGEDLLDDGIVIADFENPTSMPLQYSPDFTRDHTVYGYGQQRAVKSTDGGSTWTVLNIPSSRNIVGLLGGTHGAHGG